MASVLSATRTTGLPLPSERPLTSGRSPTSGGRQRIGSEIHGAPRAPGPTRNVARGEDSGGAGLQVPQSSTTSSPLLSSRCTLANGCVVELLVPSFSQRIFFTSTGIETNGDLSSKALKHGMARQTPRHAAPVMTPSTTAPARNVSDSSVPRRQRRYRNPTPATHSAAYAATTLLCSH